LSEKVFACLFGNDGRQISVVFEFHFDPVAGLGGLDDDRLFPTAHVVDFNTIAEAIPGASLRHCGRYRATSDRHHNATEAPTIEEKVHGSHPRLVSRITQSGRPNSRLSA
jgi:hypothetical protein